MIKEVFPDKTCEVNETLEDDDVGSVVGCGTDSSSFRFFPVRVEVFIIKGIQQYSIDMLQDENTTVHSNHEDNVCVHS